MTIVDTHNHVFTNDRKKYPQVHDTTRGASIPTVTDIGQLEWPETTVETLIREMDEAGVQKATLVQAYFKYEFDNSYTIDSANAYPKRLVSIAVLDPVDPTSPDKLSDLVENHGCKGIRLMRGRLPVCTLDDPRSEPLWKRVSELKIPLCIHDQVKDLSKARKFIEKYGDVSVALDHGWGHKVGEPPYEMLKNLFDMAPFQNVYVKTAINNIEAAKEGKGTPKIFYTTLVEKFGAKRIMWSSNFPAHPHFGSIKNRLKISQDELAFLPKDDQEWIFGKTALKVWPWLNN